MNSASDSPRDLTSCERAGSTHHDRPRARGRDAARGLRRRNSHGPLPARRWRRCPADRRRDCVVDLATTAEYYAFIGRLRTRGFTECTDEGAPLCRLTYAGIRVDIVATANTGIGPTNRWYRQAVVEPALHPLSEDLDIRAITPVFFVATKLEAFRGRGGGDYLASHDIEDTLTVLAGLPALREQIAHDATSVAREVRAELVALREKEAFIDAVPAHFDGDDVGQRRADEVLAWLASLRAR